MTTPTSDEVARQFMYDWMRQDGDSLSCSRADFTDALARTLRQFKAGTAYACPPPPPKG